MTEAKANREVKKMEKATGRVWKTIRVGEEYFAVEVNTKAHYDLVVRSQG